MKTEEQESCDYRFSSIISISLISSYRVSLSIILGVLSFSKATWTYLKIAKSVQGYQKKLFYSHGPKTWVYNRLSRLASEIHENWGTRKLSIDFHRFYQFLSFHLIVANFFSGAGLRLLSWECCLFQRQHKHIQKLPKMF